MNDNIDVKEHNRLWYENTYNNLITKCRSRGLDKKKLKQSGDNNIYHKHHIIPKCMNGKDENNNYVLLTIREHIIAHKLLCKIYPNNLKLKRAMTRLMTAIVYDENGKKTKIKLSSSRDSALLLSLYTELMTGPNNPNYGKPLPIEISNKISSSKTGTMPPPTSVMNLRRDKIFRVKDDKGRLFNSVKDCAVHNNISSTQVRRLIDRGIYINVDNKSNSRYKIQGPDGTVYNTKTDAAKAMSRNTSTITAWLKSKPNEWRLLDEPSEKCISENHKSNISKGLLNSKKAYTKKIQGPDGTVYRSITECEREVGHDRHVIRKWIRNNPEKGYKDID